MQNPNNSVEILNKLDKIEDVKKLGSLLWWSIEESKITRQQLEIAFFAANIPDSYLPRQIDTARAFKRALSTLEKMSNKGQKYAGVVISKIAENEARAVYAIHSRMIDKYEEKCDIQLADQISLNKLTGTIDYGAKWAELIQELLGDCQMFYTANDIRGIVRDLVIDWCSALPVRDRGAVYFATTDQEEKIEKAEMLIKLLDMKGGIFKFPVYKPEQRQISAIADQELMAQFDELENEVEDVCASSRYKTKLVNRLEALENYRKKAYVYATSLEFNAEKIFDRIEKSKQKINNALSVMNSF